MRVSFTVDGMDIFQLDLDPDFEVWPPSSGLLPFFCLL